MAAKAVVGSVDFLVVQLLSMVVNMFSFDTLLAYNPPFLSANMNDNR